MNSSDKTPPQRNPLKSVSWLKIIYRNGDVKTRGYGSKAEAFEAFQYLISHPYVEHVVLLDKEPVTASE